MLQKLYDNFLANMTKLLKFLLAVSFIFCFIVGIAQVLARYILPFNLSWTTEITVYGFVWMSMLGAAIAGGEKGHIAMDFLKLRLKGRPQQIVELVIYLSNTLVFFVLTYYGIILTMRNAVQLSPVMRISMAIPYSAVPFGALCLALYTLRHIIELLEKRNGVSIHG